MGALRAALTPRFGPRRFRAFLGPKGDPGLLAEPDALELARRLALPMREAQQLCRQLRAVDVDAALAQLEALGASVITYGDVAYPQPVDRLHDPPSALFVRGSLPEPDEIAVALVGSRKASEYGLRVARTLAGDLARAGITVVSGLARGIDAAAHEAVLEAGGRTIAVLGSGLARPYPPEHTALLERIVEQGAVVSELPPEEPPRARNFPRRNRIIAALGKAVVVVEAGERSGALSTARHAAELGIDVLAVPGPVDASGSRGTLALLRDGAAPAASVQDVLTAIGFCRRIPLRLPDAERAVLEVIPPVGATAAQVDAELGFGLDASAGYLVTLEVRGLIERMEGGKYYVR